MLVPLDVFIKYNFYDRRRFLSLRQAQDFLKFYGWDVFLYLIGCTQFWVACFSENNRRRCLNIKNYRSLKYLEKFLIKSSGQPFLSWSSKIYRKRFFAFTAIPFQSFISNFPSFTSFFSTAIARKVLSSQFVGRKSLEHSKWFNFLSQKNHRNL